MYLLLCRYIEYVALDSPVLQRGGKQGYRAPSQLAHRVISLYSLFFGVSRGQRESTKFRRNTFSLSQSQVVMLRRSSAVTWYDLPGHKEGI